jgi:hypothetical protein
MYKLSPSTLSLFRECPRCFWLQFRKGIRRPEGIFPSLPSGMDRILKRHFEAFMERKRLPPELSALKGVALFDDKPLLSVWTNNRKGLQWADSEGNVLRGAVDCVLRKGKKLIVLDFKTRGFPLKEDTARHYQDQVDIYNYLLSQNGYDTEKYSYLLFYHPHEVNRKGDVIFHTDLVKIDVVPHNAEKLFREALSALKGRKPKAAKDCTYCRWSRENL